MTSQIEHIYIHKHPKDINSKREIKNATQNFTHKILKKSSNPIRP